MPKPLETYFAAIRKLIEDTPDIAEDGTNCVQEKMVALRTCDQMEAALNKMLKVAR